MKVSEAKSNPRPKAFIEDKEVTLIANFSNNTFIDFTAKHKGKTRVSPINKSYNVLKAWKELENWIASFK